MTRDGYGWAVFENHQTVHVTPILGLFEQRHGLGLDCWCLPRSERGQDARLLIIHSRIVLARDE